VRRFFDEKTGELYEPKPGELPEDPDARRRRRDDAGSRTR